MSDIRHELIMRRGRTDEAELRLRVRRQRDLAKPREVEVVGSQLGAVPAWDLVEQVMDVLPFVGIDPLH